MKYDGKAWNHVGIRFKGNSTLNSAWRTGSYKLPFRINTDEFEDTYPTIKNQRFYGFKKLSFGNGFSDNSLLREVVASELFRSAGVPVARVAFYRLYIDHGDGPKYFGLYAMSEDPDGPMLKEQFKKSSGNLYKPEGTGADWTTFSQEGFVKKTNEDDADWSDIQEVIGNLHSDRSDAAAWRKKLEEGFNVDGFLRWIAMTTLMQHWDSYGAMAHNDYLYADPGENNRIHWISWDHNMVMMNMNGRNATQLGLPNVDGNRWPLLRYLIDEPVYRKSYNGYVAEFQKKGFALSTIIPRLQVLHNMIKPYVTGKDGEQKGYTQLTNADAFNNSVKDLTTFITARHKAADEYLKAQ